MSIENVTLHRQVSSQGETKPIETYQTISEMLGGLSLREYTRNVERRFLSLALERNKGNASKAAIELGLKRTAFVERCKALGIERSRKMTPAGGTE